MKRREWAAALLLFAASARAEPLDADLLAFLAEEAADARSGDDGTTESGELVAWLQDWWVPPDATATPQREQEQSP